MEGARGIKRSNDAAEGVVQILQDISRGHSQNTKSFLQKQRIASSVSARLIAKAVPFPVNLHDQPPLKTGKIHRDWTDRKLASELQAVGAASKHLPQEDLRQAHLSP